MDGTDRVIFGSKNIFLFFLGTVLIFFSAAGSAYGAYQLSQCANDSNNDGIIQSCQWITGALNQNNSDYAESDGVPQRLFLTLTSSGSENHTVTFQYDFSKNNAYAYDFLVDVDHTMPLALISPCSNLPPFTDPEDCVNAFAVADNVPIPSDPFDAVAAREHPPSRNIRFGCIKEGGNADACTNISIDPPVHIPSTNCFQDCGDSAVQITVHFRTPTSGDYFIGMYLAGELAPAFDPDGAGPKIGWGAGYGASSAPGASFHFKFINLDGNNIGGQDDQLTALLVAESHDSDLEVTKTCPGTVVKGNNVSYTITVNNNGPDTATNVFIDDTLPSGTTFVSASTSQGTCTTPPVGGVLHCDIGFMVPDEPVTINVVVTVPIGFGDSSITDSVLVGGPTSDPNTDLVCSDDHGDSCAVNSDCIPPTGAVCATNNTATCTTDLTTPVATVDLAVDKSCPGDAIAGDPDNLTYTLTVKNLNQNNDATNVVLTDSLPGGVTFVSSTPGGPICTESGGVVTCNPGTIAACDNYPTCDTYQKIVTIIVHVGPSVRAPIANPITNSATVSSDQADANTSDNSDSCDTTVNGEIDLGVQKTCPGSAEAGSQISYDLTVTNGTMNGTCSVPSTALGAHVEDILPSGVTFVSATPSHGSCTFIMPDIVHCDVGDIAPCGTPVTVHIVVQIDSEATVSLLNNAEIHFHTNAGEDNNASNDTAECTTNVTTPASSIDVEITKTDNGPVCAGSDLTYTLTVTNNDASDPAHNVVVVDTLPAGVTFVSSSPDASGSPSTPPFCTESGGVVTCHLGTIDASSNEQVTITVQVAPSVRGTITNMATVTEDETDSNTSNNHTTKDTNVVGCDALGITKSDSPDPVFDGSLLTYTIDVSNAGPSDSTGVMVYDNLPAGVLFVSASTTQGSCSHNGNISVTCDLGTIDAPDPNPHTVTITIVVRVNLFLSQGESAVITNFAHVYSVEDPTDAATQENTTVDPPPIIPTLTEWGMIILMLLAGLAGVYHLRRKRKV